MISWRFFGPGGSIRQLHQKLKITPSGGFFMTDGRKIFHMWKTKNHKNCIQKHVDISDLAR